MAYDNLQDVLNMMEEYISGAADGDEVKPDQLIAEITVWRDTLTKVIGPCPYIHTKDEPPQEWR